MTDQQINELWNTAHTKPHAEFITAVKSIVGNYAPLQSAENRGASIADTAGAKPVAYEVHWPNGEHELIYASALRMISDLGDFTLTELYAATPAPSVADTAGAKARESLQLTCEQAIRLNAALESPSEPNEALKGAMEKFRAQESRERVSMTYEQFTELASKAKASNDAAGAKDAERFLTESDMAALFMFVSQCEDSEADGYTARKETMKRLAELGCVESKGFGRYAPTMFGLWLIETAFEQNPSLPLLTRADYNAKSAKESGND